MDSSFFFKIAIAVLLLQLSITQTHARKLYKWVDRNSITNYSEFQPKEGSTRKLEVLESRGNEHVDPMMAVTAEMKPIEIPVDPMNLQGTSSSAAATQTVKPSTQTVVKQGVLAAQPYTTPMSSTVVSNVIQKKESQTELVQQTSDKKETPINPVADKAASTVVVTEKTANTTITIEKKEKPQAIVVAQPEKKDKPKINPWTRTPIFSPSNLVPSNLPKVKVP
ncbi:hypothetical protein NK318_12765 [Acinetobacter junii]|uniref:hypothetical protein n=1 Tax=Acinetobacter junii TaxID=40215 RepID=UPI0035FBD22F